MCFFARVCEKWYLLDCLYPVFEKKAEKNAHFKERLSLIFILSPYIHVHVTEPLEDMISKVLKANAHTYGSASPHDPIGDERQSKIGSFHLSYLLQHYLLLLQRQVTLEGTRVGDEDWLTRAETTNVILC